MTPLSTSRSHSSSASASAPCASSVEIEAAEQVRDVAALGPWRVVLERALEALQEQRRAAGGLDLGVDRPVLRGGLDAVGQPLELAVDDEPAAELEDVRALAEQLRVLEDARVAAARVDHDLDPGAVARLQGAHGVERERAVGGRAAATRSGPSNVPSRSTYMQRIALSVSRLTAILALWPRHGRPSPGSGCSKRARSTTVSSTTPTSREQSARYVPIPDDLHHLVRRGASPSRDRPPLRAPGAGDRERMGGPDDRHDGDGLRKVAVLSAADAGGAHPGPEGASALPVPDEGARAGPGALTACVRPDDAGAPGDLRRRHTPQRAGGDPQAQQPDPDQSRHAPRRDPPAPSIVGGSAREPRVRRHRRGPRLPRRLRLPRRQRAAAPASRRSRLRDLAAVPADERDDRQPARARGRPHRARRDRADRRGQRAGRGAARRDLEPAAARRAARHARLGAVRGRRAACPSSSAPARGRSAS